MSAAAAVLGICKALYDYSSQQPNPAEEDKEVSINENETLYILERGDDGWWKVRKKAEGEEELGEEGLVPANYVEEVIVYAGLVVLTLGYSYRACYCYV